jgi:Flp pilus assembly pilin Flp
VTHSIEYVLLVVFAAFAACMTLATVGAELVVQFRKRSI